MVYTLSLGPFLDTRPDFMDCYSSISTMSSYFYCYSPEALSHQKNVYPITKTAAIT